MELCALAGISPEADVSPREAWWMAQARARDRWNHTASLLCQMHNMLAKHSKRPSDFHPLERVGRGGADVAGFFERAKALFGKDE